jgi:hypothetical protein
MFSIQTMFILGTSLPQTCAVEDLSGWFTRSSKENNLHMYITKKMPNIYIKIAIAVLVTQ